MAMYDDLCGASLIRAKLWRARESGPKYLLSASHLIEVSLHAEIRFVDGGECYGRLEMLHGINIASRGPYGQACTRDTSDADIQVVCRQLGCDPEGALRVDPVQYVHLLKLRYEPFWWSEWSHTQVMKIEV